MKILVIASNCGHWAESLRISKAFDQHQVIYISTSDTLQGIVAGHKLYTIPKSTKYNKIKSAISFRKIFRIVSAEKPDFVISTGAIPGLIGILAGKFSGAKTIWVDSIINIEKISLGGQVASYIVDKMYTQWPYLADSKVEYAENILL